MRRVVTGEEIAQLHNPDPFAVPAWRSPVYRTPLAIVAIVHAARLLGRLMRFGFRHPIGVLAAIAGVVMWRVIGWLGLTVLAVGLAWGAGAGVCPPRRPGRHHPCPGHPGPGGLAGAAGRPPRRRPGLAGPRARHPRADRGRYRGGEGLPAVVHRAGHAPGHDGPA